MAWLIWDFAFCVLTFFVALSLALFLIFDLANSSHAILSVSTNQSTHTQLPKIGEKFVKLQKAFSQFDANGDGVIDQGELAQALKVLGADVSQEQAKSVFASADIHTNNGLNLREFIISLSLA